ncbi:MAG: carbohydrate kinase [Acidobacteria bacterium]|nr:carbohydrate kinase [Acidobacteriota bacterium]
MNEIVIFGEVLFDEFPDGNRVMGGAPFNVAWHLQGFGLAPVMISRVGRDEAGDAVLEAMREWGMTIAGIQRDPSHPTGRVQVVMQKDQPRFNIVPYQAYDYIDLDQAESLLAPLSPAILCHGTLAVRHNVSRRALGQLHRNHRVPAFLDINLRSPWWEWGIVREWAGRARWLKLNADELQILSHDTAPEHASVAEKARRLRRNLAVEWLWVTLGREGAMVTGSDDFLAQESPPPVTNLVDTVGAGDAFSAVALWGLLHDWPPGLTLQRAVEFAARMCEIQGATTTDRELYRRQVAGWEKGADGWK